MVENTPIEYASPNLVILVYNDKIIVESYNGKLVIAVDKVVDIEAYGKWYKRKIEEENTG